MSVGSDERDRESDPATAPTLKAPPGEDREGRKERILHTRVPESLDRHIKRRARSLGMSVSTVVRNVLLNAFGLIDDIMTDTANMALSLKGEEPVPRGERARPRGGAEAALTIPDVLAWQEAVLNLNAVCDECNVVLRKGVRAALGVRERPGPRAIICTSCLGIFGAGTRARNVRGTRAKRTARLR
jgi:hypothetical protein